MTKKTITKSITYVNRLGRHHFAHLRAIAQGIDVQESAKRYLGVEHGHEAITAHRQAAESVRAIARRHSDPAWRLIGLRIKVKETSQRPPLEDFIGNKELDGFSESEVLELYEEAYPSDPKSARRYRLQERQLATLKRIEDLAAESPRETDAVSGWFDNVTATKLVGAGIINLGELNTKIAAGGRWFSALPSIGIAKAKRIQAHLATLLPASAAPARPLFALATSPSLFAIEAPGHPSTRSFQTLSNLEGDHPALLSAQTDADAVEAWIAARAGSKQTATAYHREAHRLLLWLQYECSGKTLAQMSIEDCLSFMAFIQNIPAAYISRRHASPGQLGWAPFRGPLSQTSQRQSVIIISSMFRWLQSAQYISANPWVLVNQKTGDDKNENTLDSKAFSEVAMGQIYDFVERQAPSPARSRIRFIFKFLESTGLRSQELLDAKLKDFSLETEGWMLKVQGKGSKNRVCFAPQTAFNALQDYLYERGLGSLEIAPPDAPLISSALDAMSPIGYQALYKTVKSWMTKAVNASALSANERSKLAGASAHWLRHSFGTTAVKRAVPLDVIQAQMGHASIQTTMNIYGRAPIKRLADELAKAFG
jgi:site-specific recombinase XerD